MKWFHGEFRDKTGAVLKFRYGESDDTSASQCTHNIETRYMNGVTVLWIEERFIPENTGDWGGWGMAEPNEFTDLIVEQRGNV